MVQKVVKYAEMVTKDGECKVQISIQLDINVNEHGITTTAKAKAIEPMESEESTDWAIPDFTSGETLKFGKEMK